MEEKKELNLTDVLALFWKWLLSCIKACLHFVVWCIRLFYRYKWITVVCICLGIAFGFYHYKFVKPYQSGFYLTCYGKSAYYPIEYTNSIGNLCGRTDNALGKELGLDSITASSVKSMQAYFVVDIKEDRMPDFPDYDKKYAKDTLINIWSKRFFYVELLTDNQEVVPVVKQALVERLKTYPTLHDAWETLYHNYEDWINAYREEMVKYDSVQAKMYRNVGELRNYSLDKGKDKGSSLRILGEEKVQIFQDERQKLMNRILGIQQEMDELSQGAVVSTLPTIYEEKSPIKDVVKCLFLAIVLELAVLLVVDNRKKLKEFLQPSDK